MKVKRKLLACELWQVDSSHQFVPGQIASRMPSNASGRQKTVKSSVAKPRTEARAEDWRKLAFDYKFAERLCLGLNLIEHLMCIGRIQTIDCRILIKTASAMDNIAKIYPSTWQGCWSSCLLWTEEVLWQRRSQWCFTCNWVLWCEWTCKSEGTVFGSEWILHAGFLGCQSDRTGVHLWYSNLHNRNLHRLFVSLMFLRGKSGQGLRKTWRLLLWTWAWCGWRQDWTSWVIEVGFVLCN